MSLIAVPHRRRATATPDGVLVQEAAAGSGSSYATLYDRHETPVYNYCLRLLNSPDDAADATQEAFVGVLRRLQTDDEPVLDFQAYLFTAARNESYALMRRRSRTTPTEDVPEEPGRIFPVDSDPERAALVQDVQEEVRVANARLAPRHREVLALREVADRSYGEIAAILGISANAAAQLLWRARAKLREELRLGAVASVAAASEDCERARLLMSAREDGEFLDDIDQDWLDEHLEDCGSCRASRAMLLEVGASYRCWLPVAALAGMRTDVLTRAGEIVGADWSKTAAAGPQGGASAHATGTVAAAGGLAAAAAVGLALAGILRSDAPVDRTARALPESPGASQKADAGAPRAAKEASDSARLGHGALQSAGRSSGRTTAGPAPSVPRRGAAPRKSPPGTPAPAPAPRKPAPRAQPPPANGPPATEPPSAPRPPPVTGPPELTAPPPPVEPSACTHPSGGPPGCPPGHGGTPPGQGGTPPGLGEPAPGHGGPPPGHRGPPRGHRG